MNQKRFIILTDMIVLVKIVMFLMKRKGEYIIKMRPIPFKREEFEESIKKGLIRKGSLIELISDRKEEGSSKTISVSNVGYFMEYLIGGDLILAAYKEIIDGELKFDELKRVNINNLEKRYYSVIKLDL